MTVAVGTALKLTGDPSTPTVLSGMTSTRFFVVNGQLTLDNLIFKEGKASGDGGAFLIDIDASISFLLSKFLCHEFFLYH